MTFASHAIVDGFASDSCMTMHDPRSTNVKFPFLLRGTDDDPDTPGFRKIVALSVCLSLIYGYAGEA